MTRAIPIVLALLAAFAPPAARSAPGAQEGAKPAPKPEAAPAPIPAPIYDEKADGAEQIAAALARAKRENRRVLVQWGANWCVWCRALHGLFKGDEAIRHELQYEYDVVLVDVGRFDKHLDVATRYGADLEAVGLPYLTILDGEGRVLASQETGPLELADSTRKAHDPQKVLELLKKHQAPYLAAEDVLAAGLAEAQKSERRVFLHFGAPWCGWCRKLEAWMDVPEVRAVLAKELVDLKIDVDRTVGGPEVQKRLRGEEAAGIPWFAILDAHGAILARGEAADGTSIGFPYEPAEIEAFAAVLARGVPRLAPEDVAVLTRSLAAVREQDERAKERARAPQPEKPAKQGE